LGGARRSEWDTVTLGWSGFFFIGILLALDLAILSFIHDASSSLSSVGRITFYGALGFMNLFFLSYSRWRGGLEFRPGRFSVRTYSDHDTEQLHQEIRKLFESRGLELHTKIRKQGIRRYAIYAARDGSVEVRFKEYPSVKRGMVMVGRIGLGDNGLQTRIKKLADSHL